MPILSLLRLGNLGVEKPLGPKSFSQRYPNMTFYGRPFKVTDADRQKIEELDRLAVEANRLIDEIILDVNALLKIASQVSTICGRPDFASSFSKGIKE